MTLSVIVPFYNEEATIGALLQKLLELDLDFQLVVVDDGSSDNGLAVAKGFASGRVLVVASDKNRGKGAAIRKGLEYVTGDFTLIKDADLEQDHNDIITLWEAAKAGEWQAVLGSRSTSWPPRWDIRYPVNQFLSLALNVVAGGYLSDIMTGYKLMRTDLMRDLNLRSNSFDIEPEICLRLLQRGVTIKEVPVNYWPRTVAQGKKIRPGHAITVLKAILKYGLLFK